MKKLSIRAHSMALAPIAIAILTLSMVSISTNAYAAPTPKKSQTAAKIIPPKDIYSLAQRLLDVGHYYKLATFEALLPSAEDPVVYDITLQSLSQPEDSLAPCDYVITWHTMAPSGPLDGFSAYYSGNHYRLRNNKLQEYHIDSNPNAFAPVPGPRRFKAGVQSTAQFADMLPQFIAEKMLEIANDTNYVYAYHPDTLISGQRRVVVDGARRAGGYDTSRFMYVFDQASGMPLRIEMENNPGSISEQIVTMRYGDIPTEGPIEITEEGLMEQWPEAFEKFRESTFRTENLVGSQLPEFTSQVLGQSDRFAYHQGDGFDSKIIIVAIDPSISTAQATIDAVRQAVAVLPSATKVLWAFNSNSESEISQLVSPLEYDEVALKSANTLLRNCGINAFPTILIVDKDGVVKAVKTGYNKDIDEFVIVSN